MRISKTNKISSDMSVISSNKMYVVLNQDGSFSPTGFHVTGKMSGVFAQPYRLSDGFLLYSGNEKLLAKEYVFEDGSSIFNYDDFSIKSDVVDDEKIFVMSFDGKPTGMFEMDICIEGCWMVEQSDFKSGLTKLYHSTEEYAIFKHEFEDCYVLVYAQNNDDLSAYGTKVNIPLIENLNIVVAFDKEVDKLKDLVGNIDCDSVIVSKQNRRKALLDNSLITTNNKSFDLAFNSLKLNYDMLVQNIEGTGESYTAGCPDFMWLLGCDIIYGALGTLSVGQTRMTRQSLKLLKDISVATNNNGRVIHEITPFGIVFNEGNLQETPHFVTAVYEYYHWSGDREFLDEMLPFCLEGIKWAESKIHEGSLCPKGAGIVEVEGIEGRVIDIAMQMINAYDKLAFLTEHIGDETKKNEFITKSINLKNEVLEKFYSEEDEFFADLICTYEELKICSEALIGSIKNTKTLTKVLSDYFEKLLAREYKDDELIPVVIKNWVSILPYAEDFVPSEIKEKGLSQMEKAEYYNYYGMKLGCKCDDKDDPVNDIYTLNKSMSINTGYLAEVFARNDNPDKAFDLLMNLVNTLEVGMSGAISETLPDDGCFMQLWSGYGIHHVFTRYILGITPKAFEDTVYINPNLPKDLTNVTINNLAVGKTILDIQFTNDNGNVKVEILRNTADYKILID